MYNAWCVDITNVLHLSKEAPKPSSLSSPPLSSLSHIHSFCDFCPSNEQHNHFNRHTHIENAFRSTENVLNHFTDNFSQTSIAKLLISFVFSQQFLIFERITCTTFPSSIENTPENLSAVYHTVCLQFSYFLRQIMKWTTCDSTALHTCMQKQTDSPKMIMKFFYD